MSWQSIRLVVFDLDGTLVDSLGDIAGALNATLSRLAPGVTPLPLARVRDFVGDGARMLVTRGLEATGVGASVDQALPAFVEAYRQRLLETTRLYPGVRELLAALGDRRLAVLTNKPGALSRAILEGLGVAGHFFRIVGGDDVARHKPDPEGLHDLMRATGSAPAQTAMVGDSAVDVRTGRAVGARTVGVTYGFAPTSLQGAPPDALVGSAPELLALFKSGAGEGLAG